jgi:hypothetical protein
MRATLSKLRAIQSGKAKADNPAEQLALASVCQKPFKRLYVSAVRFYLDAFDDKPQLANDLDAGHRYNAACAAALAGCGQGADTDQLDSKEHARLRRRALDWLRADLTLWGQLLETDPAKVRPIVVPQMQHWQKDSDFVGVRDADALSRLPEAERRDWQQLWRDAETLRQRAHSSASPDRKKSTPTKESPALKR